MAFLEDAQLLAKKVLVTLIIYIVPVTILVGGLLLTKHLLGGDDQPLNVKNKSGITLSNHK